VDTAALIVLGVAWLVILLRLAAELTGRSFAGRRPQGPAYRWMGAGLLVMFTGLVATLFGQVRHWPAGQLHTIATVNLVLAVAGTACLIIGVVAVIRSRRDARGAS
jgi:membrane protease YdiL (CAAX protease family)